MRRDPRPILISHTLKGNNRRNLPWAMNRMHLKLLKIILALLALNCIPVYFYLNSTHCHNLHNLTEDHHDTTADGSPVMVRNRGTHLLKPWPIIPSYMPWSHNPIPASYSCESYFGNGFTKVADVLPAKASVKSGSSWFRCHFSETLISSICEGGKIRMDPDKIKMSRGGEKLEDVIGRAEEEEMPEFEDGAFQVEGEGGAKLKRRKLVDEEFLNEFLHLGYVSKHTMRELVRSVVVVGENDFTCQEWIEEPTLVITRYEYTNFFHTVTDWYSAYVSSRVTGLPNRPHLVFLDGHCETRLDETWRALFSSLRYAKNFSSSVCFRHAIFPPLGYETTFFKGLTKNIDCEGASASDLWRNPDDKKTARLSEFGEMIIAGFGFPVNKHHADKAAASIHNVLFIRREDYLAHPRHKGKVESRLDNEAQVFESLQRWAEDNDLQHKVNLVNGLFGHMSMKDQVRAIQDASVIIGAHGAGLTHIVSATPNTVVLEMVCRYCLRPHYRLIAKWKGLEYHAIILTGVSVKPDIVIDKLNEIMNSVGFSTSKKQK